VTNNISPAAQSIVLAIDGSEHAMAARQLIQNLPLPRGCKISIVTVLIPRNAQYYAARELLLEQTRIYFQSLNLEVDTHLLTGYPAEQIIKFSNENNTDLIVLGAKGLRGTLKILLGGVAQQVVNYAKCPVLIVRSPHTQAKKVLIVTDGSQNSEYAIQHLGRCPLPKDSSVSIMHILPPEMTTDMLIRSWPYGVDALPHVLTEEVEESILKRSLEEEKQGNQLLKESGEILSGLNIDAAPVLLRGDAATEILNYADHHKVDLIIAGSRGLNQVQSWILGSVSSKLTHYANCSVLIVKDPEIARAE
jgi:nucleotide-binding universal stress UspA family protein